MGSEEFERFRSDLMEKMALMFEQGGLSPLVGRIYSLLICSPEPVSLQEIAGQLGVTKAAVSIQVRALVSHGFCLKLARGKDRKDYYCVPEDHLQISMRSVTERLALDMQRIEDTLRKLPDSQSVKEEERAALASLTRRFMELAVFYRVVFRRLEGIEEEMESVISNMRAPNGQDPF